MKKRFGHWFRRPVVVRHDGPVEWGVNEGRMMRYFWASETGRKLKALLEDALIATILQPEQDQPWRHQQSFIEGMRYMMRTLLSYQAPLPKQQMPQVETTNVAEVTMDLER